MLCKNINILLYYWEVSIYLKYCKSHLLQKPVKMFWIVYISKSSAVENTIFFIKWKRSARSVAGKYFLADLKGNPYLFEIYHTSLTITNCGKVDVSKDLSDGERQFFILEGYKVSCVKYQIVC